MHWQKITCRRPIQILIQMQLQVFLQDTVKSSSYFEGSLERCSISKFHQLSPLQSWFPTFVGKEVQCIQPVLNELWRSPKEQFQWKCREGNLGNLADDEESHELALWQRLWSWKEWWSISLWSIVRMLVVESPHGHEKFDPSVVDHLHKNFDPFLEIFSEFYGYTKNFKCKPFWIFFEFIFIYCVFTQNSNIPNSAEDTVLVMSEISPRPPPFQKIFVKSIYSITL